MAWGRRLYKTKGNKMAYYESVLVFRQDLTEPQVKEKAAKFTEIIKELGGDVKATEFWGLKNLAYIIRKNRKAHGGGTATTPSVMMKKNNEEAE